jgi:hypothetical protein
MNEAEPNPLSHRKFHLTVPGVIELLVVLLCLLYAFLDFSQELVPGRHLSLHRRLVQRRRVPVYTTRNSDVRREDW